jgi:hypothetical protein
LTDDACVRVLVERCKAESNSSSSNGSSCSQRGGGIAAETLAAIAEAVGARGGGGARRLAWRPVPPSLLVSFVPTAASLCHVRGLISPKLRGAVPGQVMAARSRVWCRRATSRRCARWCAAAGEGRGGAATAPTALLELMHMPMTAAAAAAAAVTRRRRGHRSWERSSRQRCVHC